MSHERGWQEKEQSDVDKKAKEVQGLKEDVKRLEENLEKEHSQRLLLEREAKEIRENITRETEAKRSLESQIMKLKAQSDGYRQQISELREANEKLGKKDCLYRLRIARKEAKETSYWLDLLGTNNTVLESSFKHLKDECNQLRYILTTIISKVEQK